MEIRSVHSSDVPALAALHALCFKEGDRWGAAQIAGSLSLATTRGYVAVEGEDIFGMLLLQKTGGEEEVLTLGVHPSRRRRGIGHDLLNCALTDEGLRSLFLEVAADNESAIALYEKTGFSLFARRKGYYRRGGGRVDALNYRYLVKT